MLGEVVGPPSATRSTKRRRRRGRKGPSPTSRRGRATTPLTPAAAHAWLTRPAEAGCRPSRSSGDGGRNRAAALQLPATAPGLGTWSLVHGFERHGDVRPRSTTSRGSVGATPNDREQHGHHPAPSVSALRRGGSRQPDIGSRSLAVQPGGRGRPLDIDCRRTCPMCTIRPQPSISPTADGATQFPTVTSRGPRGVRSWQSGRDNKHREEKALASFGRCVRANGLARNG